MRRKFSERIGRVAVRESIQREEIDERLSARMWTTIDVYFFTDLSDYLWETPKTKYFWYLVFDNFLGRPFDEASSDSKRNISTLRTEYFGGDWSIKYDICDFFGGFADIIGSDQLDSEFRQTGEMFRSALNLVLEEEKSAYRFVSGEIIEITSGVEIEAIENAISPSPCFKGAEEHLKAALRFYADRKTPDYRNSIKESISAIESGYNSINGEKSRNLPEAIKKAEKLGFLLHPALSRGIQNIYGWTSNEDGIRHAMTEAEVQVAEPEAKLMLTMCSSMLGYIKQKSS